MCTGSSYKLTKKCNYTVYCFQHKCITILKVILSVPKKWSKYCGMLFWTRFHNFWTSSRYLMVDLFPIEISCLQETNLNYFSRRWQYIKTIKVSIPFLSKFYDHGPVPDSSSKDNLSNATTYRKSTNRK